MQSPLSKDNIKQEHSSSCVSSSYVPSRQETQAIITSSQDTEAYDPSQRCTISFDLATPSSEISLTSTFDNYEPLTSTMPLQTQKSCVVPAGQYIYRGTHYKGKAAVPGYNSATNPVAKAQREAKRAGKETKAPVVKADRGCCILM